MKISISSLLLCAIIAAVEISAQDNIYIRSGELQLRQYKTGKKLYKSRPLYAKQTKIKKYWSTYMRQQGKESDWAGQYFALQKDVAESYGTGYLTDGKGGFYLKEYKVKKPFFVLQIRNPSFASGTISQEIKAQKLKEFFKDNALGRLEDHHCYTESNSDLRNKLLDISKVSFRDTYKPPSGSGPLMRTLGSFDLAVECPHDRTNYELIIPLSWDVNKLLEETGSEVLVPVDLQDGVGVTRYANIDAKMSDKDRRSINAQIRALNRENEDLNVEITY